MELVLVLVKWVRHHSRERSPAAEGGRVSRHGEELEMNRIRSPKQPARGDPPARVLGEVLTSPHCKKLNVLEALHKVSELDRSCGTTQAVERSGLLWFRLWTVGGLLRLRFLTVREFLD
jgi:hypothetical protein